jgi:hypothetical protein
MNREGNLRIIWANSKDRLATPRYIVTFASYQPPTSFGAQMPREIVGEAELLHYLQRVEVGMDELKIRMTELHAQGHREFAHTILSDEKLAELGLI